MTKNKLIEEYLEYWTIKLFFCEDIENLKSAGSFYAFMLCIKGLITMSLKMD